MPLVGDVRLLCTPDNELVDYCKPIVRNPCSSDIAVVRIGRVGPQLLELTLLGWQDAYGHPFYKCAGLTAVENKWSCLLLAK